jgi:hypothetical protein
MDLRTPLMATATDRNIKMSWKLFRIILYSTLSGNIQKRPGRVPSNSIGGLWDRRVKP